MSEQESSSKVNDGTVDAIAMVATISIIVMIFVFWLSGQ